ncbi:hypothetical protein [Pseudoroseomonas ludipueritiae]|nr:hypothetical protein [Pseudoroseomonas ludipueritiae]
MKAFLSGVVAAALLAAVAAWVLDQGMWPGAREALSGSSARP